MNIILDKCLRFGNRIFYSRGSGSYIETGKNAKLIDNYYPVEFGIIVVSDAEKQVIDFAFRRMLISEPDVL